MAVPATPPAVARLTASQARGLARDVTQALAEGDMDFAGDLLCEVDDPAIARRARVAFDAGDAGRVADLIWTWALAKALARSPASAGMRRA